MLPALKTSSQKSTSKFNPGRYILIVGAALILAILLYAALHVTDSAEQPASDAETQTDPTNVAEIGVQPPSFQEINEFRDGTSQRLRLSGKAEPEAVVFITNRGEGLRQVRVNNLGQWGLTIDVEDKPMALEAQLYQGEDTPAIRSEETVFRLPIPSPAPVTSPQGELPFESETETAPASPYKTSALIMVAAPGSPTRVIQTPYGGSPTSGPLSLSVIDYDFLGGVIISGTSSVPGRVRIYAGDAVIGETGIGVGGRWNSIAGRMLPRRKIQLRAELIPASGAQNALDERISVSVPFIFLPPLQEEDTDGSGALSVYIDAEQWQVRRTLIGGGGQTTVIFAPLTSETETAETDANIETDAGGETGSE